MEYIANISFHFFKDFIYLFREKRKGGKEGEKHQCVVASHTPPTGDLAQNPGMCPDWKSNQRPLGSQPALNPARALFLFRERGREGEREVEKHQCVVASYVPPTGDLDRNPGTCPDWQPFGLQACIQSTEPHRPGLKLYTFKCLLKLLTSFVYLISNIM